MKKYLVIGHKFGALKRGSYVVSKRFCEEHNEYCEFKEDRRSRNLRDLNQIYRRIIFRCQVPRCYSFPVNFVNLRTINHIIYLRASYTFPLYNSCTNGFHYYREHKNIKYYVPMITDFPKVVKADGITLGFYVRKWLTPDSFDCFMDILDNLKEPMNVCVMGDHAPEIEHHNNVLHYNHTNDNVQFHSLVSHYFYPTSKSFIDPFPHSVLEAVQSGSQIIFPVINRTFKDGIDDIKDCINWTETFKPDIKPDIMTGYLTSSNWKRFYQDIFDNNWEFDFCRETYRNFGKFIQDFVL